MAETWSNLESNPLIVDGTYHRRDPSRIIEIGGTFYIYYVRLPSDAADTFDTYGSVICVASASSLAGPWAEQGVVLEGTASEWDENGVIAPDVVVDETTIYLFYDGLLTAVDKSKSVGVASISTATPTGTFSKSASNPIVVGSVGEWDAHLAASSFPAKLGDGSWRLYYKGRSTSSSSDRMFGIATCTAANFPDGPWNKYGSNPIFGLTTNGSPNVEIDDASFLFENGKFYIAYQPPATVVDLKFYESANGIDTWTDTTDFEDVLATSLVGTWCADECMGYVISNLGGKHIYLAAGGYVGSAKDGIGIWTLTHGFFHVGGSGSIVLGGSGSITL